MSSIGSSLRAFWRGVMAIRRSVIAFVVGVFGGLLTLGATGAVLYYAVALFIPVDHPPLDDWRGDWVWPTMIAVSVAWPLGFVFAGALNHWQAARARPTWLRVVSYLAVLWLWAYLLWWWMLAMRDSF